MESNPQSSIVVLFTRVFWMMIGPFLLILLTFTIVNMGTGWLTAADVGFFVVLGAIIVSRWFEFLGGHPQTATGEPATFAHFRRFLVGTVLIGVSIWVIANVLGNHVLAR
jgi:hypothetical protein